MISAIAFPRGRVQLLLASVLVVDPDLDPEPTLAGLGYPRRVIISVLFVTRRFFSKGSSLRRPLGRATPDSCHGSAGETSRWGP